MAARRDADPSALEVLGPHGTAALVVLAAVLLLRSKAVRGALWRAARRLLRRLARWVGLVLWAWRLRIGVRLAWRLQLERWNAMVDARKLPGLRRGKVRRTAAGIVVHLTLNGALTFDVVSSRLDQLEAGLGVRRGSARLKAASRADRAQLHIVTRDPLAKPVAWTPPVEPVRLADPVRLSVTPFGDVVEVDVRQRIGVFGTSGSGKSCVQRVLAAHVVRAVDADLVVMDLKFGTESQHFAGKARRITDIAEAAGFTEWLIDAEFPRRAARMQQLGTSSWQESAEEPALVVMVDEGNVLTREFSRDQLKRFFRAVEQGRALGVYFLWATQYPKATNLPTELRSQLNVRICLVLNSSEESAMVFKDEVDDGWAPHKLPGPGWLLIKSDRHRAPEESRSVWLDEKTFRALEPGRPVPATAGAPAAAAAVPMAKDAPETAGAAPAAAAPRTAPTVADLAWSVLLLADRPLGVRELAREIDRDPGAVQRALNRMAAAGDVRRTEDRKYTAALGGG